MKLKTLQLIALTFLLILMCPRSAFPQLIVSNQPDLIAVQKKRVGKGGPTLIFKLYSEPALSNFWYRIDVCRENDEVLQSESIRNGIPLNKPDSFQIVDINRDGFRDIKILGGYRKGSTKWFKTWLYNPAQHKFVWTSSNS